LTGLASRIRPDFSSWSYRRVSDPSLMLGRDM
jgi:hypothetical protein